MAEKLPEIKYKNEIPDYGFIKAISTEWNELQEKNYKENGIRRLKTYQVQAEYNLNIGAQDDEIFTVIYNAKIISNDEEIIINDIELKLNSVIFINSKLPNLKIENCKLKIGTDDYTIEESTSFYFKNCHIEDIIISNSFIGSFELADNSTIGNVRIENSKTLSILHDNSTSGNFRINKSSLNAVSFRQGSSVQHIDIIESNLNTYDVYNSQTGSLMISNQCIVESIIISRSNSGAIKIDRSLITGSIWIASYTTCSFCDFTNSVIGDLYILDNSQTDFIKIIDCITGDFDIYNSKSSSWEINEANGNFKFNKAEIYNCKLLDCKIHELRCENSCKMELYISDGYINTINFEQITIGKEVTISIAHAEIYSCILDEFIVLGNLYFRNCYSLSAPINLDWDFLLANNEFSFIHSNIRNEALSSKKDIAEKRTKTLLKNNIQPTFRMSLSSLGKTEFTECDLAAFNFQYNNSKITEIFISGGTVPKKISIPDETDPLQILEQEKSFFNQLKKVFEGQGDIVRGTQYHAKASAIQMDILKLEKGRSTEW